MSVLKTAIKSLSLPTQLKSSLFIIIFILVVADVATAGYYQRFLKFPNTEVRVCIASTKNFLYNKLSAKFDKYIDHAVNPINHLEKIQVMIDGVNSAYTKEKTIVHFEGWELCKDVEDMRSIEAIVFFYDDANAGLRINGAASYGKSETLMCYYPAVAMNINRPGLSGDNKLIGTALHEFGHLVGLIHEHERPEFTAQGSCDLGADHEDPSFYKEHWRKKAKQAIGNYDDHSIMNYCNRGRIDKDNPARLTDTDLRTLQHMYGFWFYDIVGNDWFSPDSKTCKLRRKLRNFINR